MYFEILFICVASILVPSSVSYNNNNNNNINTLKIESLLPGADFTKSSGIDERYPYPDEKQFQTFCVQKEIEKKDILSSRIENIHKHFFRLYDLNMTSQFDTKNKETSKKLKLINQYLLQLKTIEDNIDNYHKTLNLMDENNHIMENMIHYYQSVNHLQILEMIKERRCPITRESFLPSSYVGSLYAGGLHTGDDDDFCF